MSSLNISSGSDDPLLGSGARPPVKLDLVSMKEYFIGMASYVSNRVTLDTVRPLNMFLGISGPSFCFSPQAFNAPVKKIDKSTYEKFKSRLKLNFSFFLSNYALLTIGVGVVTALMHPGMIISVCALWALWGLHHFLISNELVVFGRNIGTILSISQRSTILMILSAVVIVWKCLMPFITVVAISGVIILTHAIARDPSHVTSEFQQTAGASGNFSDDSDESHESDVLVEKPSMINV